MNTPNGDLEVYQGDLEILREYSCGCIVYRIQLNGRISEPEERGLFCDGRGPWLGGIHKLALVQGKETQRELFS